MIYLTSFIIFLINTLVSINLECEVFIYSINFNISKTNLTKFSKLQGSNAQEIADVYKNVTLAHQYEQDFHVVFGMILSTMLIMGTFLLIAVITIWGMDPGKFN